MWLRQQQGIGIVEYRRGSQGSSIHWTGRCPTFTKRRFGIDIRILSRIAQLHHAARTGNGKAVRRLVGLGVDPDLKDYHGRTPLWWSASNDSASFAVLFLERDTVQPNAMDINGWTPLHIAAANGHIEVVRLLLSKEGMDPELVDDSG
jgi:ankyrin repeat protein